MRKESRSRRKEDDDDWRLVLGFGMTIGGWQQELEHSLDGIEQQTVSKEISTASIECISRGKASEQAGASLESLAKGAVCFLRRYTICELQDRWRALLYDSDTLAEASAHIVKIEAEHAAASSRQKANQTCNSIGKESSSWKRKIDNVRSYYYAMRKRIHIEHCSAHIFGENLISVNNSLNMHDIRLNNALGTRNAYKSDDVETNPLLAFDLTNSNTDGNLCYNFLGNDNSSSHIPDSGSSSDQVRYSCRPSGLPTWRSVEDRATPSAPMEGQYGDKDQGLLNLDDDKKTNAPGCDVASSEPNLDNEICSAAFSNQPIMSNDDFMDICFEYVDFDEDLGFADVGEKEISDGPSLTSLNSILLSSPHNIKQDTVHHINQDVVSNSNDPGPTNISETCLGTSDNIDVGSYEDISLLGVASSTYDYHSTSLLDVVIPPVSPQTSNITEALVEFLICVLSTEQQEIPNNEALVEFLRCVLSTEQQEIPNNDNVIFPHEIFTPCSVVHRSAKVLFSNGRPPTGDVMKVKEDAGNVQPTASSVKTDSMSLLKAEFLHFSDGHRVEVESPKGISVGGVFRYAGTVVDEQNFCTSETVAIEPTPVAASKEEVTAPNFFKYDKPAFSFASFLENHLQGIDHPKAFPLEITDSCQKEVNIQGALQMCSPSHRDLVSKTVYSDAVAIMSILEQEQQHSDSEDDIPNFSDIDALILNMDLGPYDEESGLFSKEVSRYQPIDTRSSIRWEQSIHSLMNKSIFSYGALEMFYGHHLKYFIKDPEINGMHFSFKVYESAMRRYNTNLGRRCREQDTRFDWKDE